MKHNYFLLFLVCVLLGKQGIAQVSTINTALTGSTSTAGPTITFAVQNNNTYPIAINEILNYHNTVNNGVTYTLWYTSTQITGAPTITTPNWSIVGSGSAITLGATAITPVITGLNFVVPASTIYRMALVHSNTSGSVYYSSSGSTVYTNAGVDLIVGNNTASPGYTGAFPTPGINGRWICGGIVFQPAAPPCPVVTGLAASSVTNNSASLNWNAVTGSQGYEYALTTSATPPSSGTATSSTNYNASGLATNTTYYMHVRNKCGATSFSAWVTTPFTTLAFVSCYPTTIVSVTNMTTSNGTLSWAPVASSQGYEYIVNQTAGSPTGNGTPISVTSVLLTGLTGGVTYYAHIRNVCQPNDKSVWYNHAFTMPLCAKPVNVLVSNITHTSADLMWSQMPNGTSYQYAVNFSNVPPPVGQLTTTTNIATQLTGLIPNSKYYVHIRTRCFSEDSSDWKLDSFITKMECYAPVPEVNHLGTNNPYAFWDPIPTAIAYEYALTNTAATPAFGATISTPYVSLTLPADDKDYYLHVRAKCNSMFTFSDWATAVLRTGSTSVKKLDMTAIHLSPNPVKNILHVEGMKDGDNYRVVDMAGRVVLYGQATTPDIDAKDIPAGVYLLKLQNTTGEQVLKFTKQ